MGRMLTAERETKKRDPRHQAWIDFNERARREEQAYLDAARALFLLESEGVRVTIDRAVPDPLAHPSVTDPYLEAALLRIAGDYAPSGIYHRAWLARYRGLIAKTIDVGGKHGAATTGFSFTLSNPRVQDVIRSRAGALVQNVTQTTMERIRDAVATGRAEGLGVQAIADRIEATTFGDIGASRALTIARTETVGALNAAEWLAATQNGVMQSKTWITQKDDRVRDTHTAIDEDTIGLYDRFDNGLLYPHELGAPPDEVINCRCTLLFSHLPPNGKSAMLNLERKSATAELKSLTTSFAIKSVDEQARTFRGLSNTWEKDQGGDVVHKGAFARTLDHWRQSGRVIPLTDGHPEADGSGGRQVERVLGKMMNAEENDFGLDTGWEFVPNDPIADAAMRRVKHGSLTGLSITYTPVRIEREKPTKENPYGVRHLHEVKLHSVGLVIHPMNQSSHADPASVKTLLAAARDGLLTDEQKDELLALLQAPASEDAPPKELAPDDPRRLEIEHLLRTIKLRGLVTAA